MTENIAKHIPFNSVIDSSRPKHRPCIQFILIFIAQKQTCISVIFKCCLSESSTSLCHNHKTYHKETKPINNHITGMEHIMFLWLAIFYPLNLDLLVYELINIWYNSWLLDIQDDKWRNDIAGKEIFYIC